MSFIVADFVTFIVEQGFVEYIFGGKIGDSIYICISMYFINTTLHLFYRYMAICHPFSITREDSNWPRRARRTNSNATKMVTLKKRTWHYLLPVIFISFAVNIPKFLEFRTTTRYSIIMIIWFLEFRIEIPICISN